MELLTRKLEDTHDEIQRVRGEVIEALKAFYGGGASSLTADEAMKIASTWTGAPRSTTPADSTQLTGSSMDLQVDQLSRTLQEIVGQLQLDATADGAAAPRLVTSFAQRERLKRQMEQSRRMLVVVDKVTRLDNLLFDVDARVDHGDIVGAAETLVAAQRLIAELEAIRQESSNGSAALDSEDIVRVLHLQFLKKKNRLLHLLNQAHSTMVGAKLGVMRIKKPFTRLGSRLAIPSNQEACALLWRASALLDILPAKVTDVVKLVSANLFKPLFGTDLAAVKLTQESDGYVVTITTPSDVAASKRSEMEVIEHKCAQIVTVIRCLHEEVLGSSVEFMQRMAESMWNSPGNLESQLLRLFQDSIPNDTSAINAYRDTIARVVHDMSTALELTGFSIPNSSQMRNFGGQINLLYAKKRRQQLLLSARSLMGQGYRNSTKVSGATERCNIDASLGSGKKDGGGKMVSPGAGTLGGLDPGDDVESGTFHMPDYRISRCAHDVVELAHQTMMEACTQDSTCANTFFHTSRDILFLFRSIVPTLYQSEITNEATSAMLFHNDCMYIAHHMLTIGHLYKCRLPAPLHQIATMVDMVPAFRDAGEKALSTFAKATSEELKSGLSAFQERGGIESESALVELEQFLKTTLYKLNHLTSAWRDGLPQAVYNHVMRSIVQPVVSGFLDQVLAAKKISANTAGKLHNLVSLLLEVQGVFSSAGQAEKYAPALSKLRRFSNILVQPIATLQDQFVKGDLADFTVEELDSLGRALFRDSPERKELLTVLAHRG